MFIKIVTMCSCKLLPCVHVHVFVIICSCNCCHVFMWICYSIFVFVFGKYIFYIKFNYCVYMLFLSNTCSNICNTILRYIMNKLLILIFLMRSASLLHIFIGFTYYKWYIFLCKIILWYKYTMQMFLELYIVSNL